MKHTHYFLFIRRRPDRAIIKDEWILDTIMHPARTEIQNDGRIRKWKFIEEAGKHLRVVLLADGETVHKHSSTEVLRRTSDENSVFRRYGHGAHRVFE